MLTDKGENSPKKRTKQNFILEQLSELNMAISNLEDVACWLSGENRNEKIQPSSESVDQPMQLFLGEFLPSRLEEMMNRINRCIDEIRNAIE